MTEHAEHSEGKGNAQDMDLEAQLDALLSDLEAIEPQTVPSDLRKSAPPEPEPKPAAEPEKSEADETEAAANEPQPVGTAAQGEASEFEAGHETEPVASAGAEVSEVASEAEASKQDPDEIDSMAAALLDQQIDATIDAASEAGDAEAEATGAQRPQPEPAADRPGPAQASSATKQSLGEDDLGAQIDALLGNVKSQSAAPAAEDQSKLTESLPEDGASRSQPVAGSTAADEPDESAEAGAVSIEQIDAMLAESAEQAIEGAPDDQLDVPGTDEILAAQAKAEEADARAEAQPQDEAPAEPSPAPVEQAAPQRQSGPEPRPIAEPVAVEPQPVPVGGAGAADVAGELDEDPKASPAVEPAAAKKQVEPIVASDGQTDGEPTVVIKPSALKRAEHGLRQICFKINQPVNRLSPEMRDTIGWVGVVTLGLGMMIFIYGVLF